MLVEILIDYSIQKLQVEGKEVYLYTSLFNTRCWSLTATLSRSRPKLHLGLLLCRIRQPVKLFMECEMEYVNLNTPGVVHGPDLLF